MINTTSKSKESTKRKPSSKVLNLKKRRLDEIRKRIESGDYQVDPEALAQRILSDQTIFSFKKKKKKKKKKKPTS